MDCTSLPWTTSGIFPHLKIFKCSRYLNTSKYNMSFRNNSILSFCMELELELLRCLRAGGLLCYHWRPGLLCCLYLTAALWYLVVPDLVKQLKLLTDSGGCFVTWIFSLLRSFNFATLCRISWGQTVHRYLINNHLETHTRSTLF